MYNCVNIIHIGEHYELRGVEDKAYVFIAEHLNELVKTEELQVRHLAKDSTYFIFRKLTILETVSEQHERAFGFIYAEERL